MHDLIQVSSTRGLVVKDEALTHEAMLVSLVLSRSEHWEYARTYLLTDVLHDLAVGTTGVDAGLSFEVGADDSVIVTFSAPPVLVPLWLFAPHNREHLGEYRVTITVVNFSVQFELRSLEPEEIAFNAAMAAFFRFFSLSELFVLDTVHAVISPFEYFTD